MDFLRLPETEGGDTRYSNLTPAQYGCMLLFVYGVAMIPYVRHLHARGGDPPAPGVTASSGPTDLALGSAVTR
jgi:hypothetical protein